MNNKAEKQRSPVSWLAELAGPRGWEYLLSVLAAPAFAVDDPLAVVENLSEFVFSLIRSIGLILLGFGILQVGLSLKSHDPSQRANGMLTVAGGIVITFTKEILSLVTGG